MGNKQSQATSDDTVHTYSTLINMGFDETISMSAANRYPKNLNQAINHILQSELDANSGDQSTTYQNKTDDIDAKKNVHCKSIRNCASLKRLIKFLKYYRNHYNDIDKLTQYFKANNHQTLNDYHHILQKHLRYDDANEQFTFIYKKMQKNELFCVIKTCKIYQRNSRSRETENKYEICNDRNLLLHIDILDCIHCYFIHSVDIGYRVLHDYTNDITMVDLRKHLSSKRRKIQEMRGTNRFETSKFNTQTFSNSNNLKLINHEQKDDKSSDNVSNTEPQYSFGLRFNYWQKWNGKVRLEYFHEKYMEPKYKSLKEEILSNAIYCIGTDQLTSAYNKAVHLMTNSIPVKAIKSLIDMRWGAIYDIPSLRPLDVKHILSVVLYTDYDSLQYHFSTTFRRLKNNESVENVMHRNREYGHWTKTLIETVNCYGRKMGKNEQYYDEVVYHGMSFLYFKSFVARFNSPTSTTRHLSIAAIFAKNDGLILELKRDIVPYWMGYLKYFDCSLFSYFGNEDEKLFIQAPVNTCFNLQFASIRNMRTDENYKQYVLALTTMEKLINFNSRRPTHGSIYQNVPQESINIINDLTNNKIKKHPQYMVKLFQDWCYEQQKIVILLDNLVEMVKGLDIMYDNHEKVMDFGKLSKLFRNACTNYLTFHGTGKMTSKFLSLIRSALKDCAFDKVVFWGAGIDCYWKIANEKALFAHEGWKMSCSLHVQQGRSISREGLVVFTRNNQ